MLWQTARFSLNLAPRPLVMGIVNVTPDSFSDGGRFDAPDAARAHCDALVAEGADILDIGGESTRPGSIPPSEAEERRRTEAVVRHAAGLGVPVSIDSSRASVIEAALAVGADIVNDVRALTEPGVLRLVAKSRAGVCLMHMQGCPETMQLKPHYRDVVAEVKAFLAERMAACEAAGMAAERIVLDPGYGFGKALDHHLLLWQHQRELLALGRPLLIGWSRKGMLGQITGRPPGERLVPSVAAALAGIALGARVVRVHDVAHTVDAIKVWQAAGLAALGAQGQAALPPLI